ncbi:MAG: glycosyltransferase, partial [Rhodomicrobium sp.]
MRGRRWWRTKLIHIVHSISSIEAEAAGTSYVATRLCGALAARGAKVDILSLGGPLDAQRDGYRDRRFAANLAWATGLRKLGRSLDMRRELFASDASVFHTHGLWMLPNIYPAQAARALVRPFVLSPHGMLAAGALQFSRLRKRVFWQWVQGPAARAVSCFHATAASEYDDIRAAGLTQPVAVIPNGIDLPAALPARPPSASYAVVSLGRIHPVKGLDRLIRAWALIEAEHPSWRLEIVGPSDGGHGEALQRLSSQLGLRQVKFSGPVYGDDKLSLLAEAELFVLPTRHENFAMTVAEALVCGTPVISTKGAPWAGLEPNGCGWWIDHGPEPMAAALRTAMALSPEQRRAMGARGREWMKRDFAWPAI